MRGGRASERVGWMEEGWRHEGEGVHRGENDKGGQKAQEE